MNLQKWAVYLPPRALAMLEALKISERREHEGCMPFAEACLTAQADADKGQVQIAVGWQMNDVTGDKEPGWCAAEHLSLLAIEPVALLYPLPRNAQSCKTR